MKTQQMIAALTLTFSAVAAQAAGLGADATGNFFDFGNLHSTMSRAAVKADVQNKVAVADFQDIGRLNSGLTRAEVKADLRNAPSRPGLDASEWFESSRISTVGGRSREDVRAEAILTAQARTQQSRN